MQFSSDFHQSFDDFTRANRYFETFKFTFQAAIRLKQPEQIHRAEETANVVFGTMDRNLDGKICFSEFEDGAEKHKDIFEILLMTPIYKEL